MKTERDKRKELFYIPVGLFIYLFITSWRHDHNLIDAAISAAVGTVGGVIVGLAFIVLWARTHSVLISFVVVAGGCIALFAGYFAFWNIGHP